MMLNGMGFGISPVLKNLVLTSSMSFGRLPQLSEPQLSHLDNGDNQTYSTGLVQGFSEVPVPVP